MVSGFSADLPSAPAARWLSSRGLKNAPRRYNSRACGARPWLVNSSVRAAAPPRRGGCTSRSFPGHFSRSCARSQASSNGDQVSSPSNAGIAAGAAEWAVSVSARRVGEKPINLPP